MCWRKRARKSPGVRLVVAGATEKHTGPKRRTVHEGDLGVPRASDDDRRRSCAVRCTASRSDPVAAVSYWADSTFSRPPASRRCCWDRTVTVRTRRWNAVSLSGTIACAETLTATRSKNGGAVGIPTAPANIDRAGTYRPRRGDPDREPGARDRRHRATRTTSPDERPAKAGRRWYYRWTRHPPDEWLGHQAR